MKHGLHLIQVYRYEVILQKFLHLFKMALVKNSLQPCLQTAINEEQHVNTDQEGIIEYAQIIEYS